MIEYPCAKINLGLNVINKRPDGYHNLETVFYPVNINDKIEIEETPNGKSQQYPCMLKINGINIDGNIQDNLIVKAYNLIKKHYTALPDISVTLTKNIPTQAGMGGGSSDCAYTIRMLNKMFKLNMSISEMQEFAAKLGADCAFFINPIPSFATGIGEKLSPINLDLSRYTLVIVKPPLKISTKEAFSNITPMHPAKCCLDILVQPIETWKHELVNDFERSLISRFNEIAEIKQKLYDIGAVYASMSGSGSAMFGIFKQKPQNTNNIFNNYFIVTI